MRPGPERGRYPRVRRTAPVISRKASSDPSSWASESECLTIWPSPNIQDPSSKIRDLERTPRAATRGGGPMNAFRASESPWVSAVQFSDSEDPRSDTTVAGRLARSNTLRANIREVAFRSALPIEALATRRRRGEGLESMLGSGVGNAARKIRAERSVDPPSQGGASEDPKMAPTSTSEQVIIHRTPRAWRSA